MPQSFAAAGTLGLLLDIEGTTTPIEFVHKILFLYARREMQSFLHRHWMDSGLRSDVVDLRAQYSLDARSLQPPAWREGSDDALRSSVLAYVNWLMDSDSKCTPLKSLQGKIWREGYVNGALKSEVFPDVRPAFLRWSEQQRAIAIFSSGSVLAQQLLFANTTSGDLTGFIREYFDTTTGPKREAESYSKIAAALNLAPAHILFISDTVGELDAARRTGMETALCIREGVSGPSPSTTHPHPWIRNFDELVIPDFHHK